MRQFLSFVKKEFYHIFRDTRTMMILILMPIVEIILFGFAITTEIRNANIAILDPSNDISTQRIIDQLDNSQYFNVTHRFVTPSQIDQAFKSGEINMAVVFEDNFNQNLIATGTASVQIISDATDPNQARMVTGYASNIIMSYQQELLQEVRIPAQINLQTRMLYNPQIKSSFNFVPGVMGLILMLICAMMTSIAIVREKELGTMEVLLASPLKPIYIILAKMVPYLTLSLFNLFTILLLSVYVLKVPVAGSLVSLGLVSIVFIVVALAMGLLISTVVKSQVAAMLISGMGLMMPVMLLSGMIFPIESMPVFLQGLSTLIPARWYISAVRKLMIAGLDLRTVAVELSVLCSMAIVLIAVSLKRFKNRLE